VPVPAGLDVLLVEQEVVGTEQSALEVRRFLLFLKPLTLPQAFACHWRYLD
jgi:hypothetical protein